MKHIGPRLKTGAFRSSAAYRGGTSEPSERIGASHFTVAGLKRISESSKQRRSCLAFQASQTKPTPWTPRPCQCGCGDLVTEMYRRPHMTPSDQPKFIPGHQTKMLGRRLWTTAFQGMIFQPQFCVNCKCRLEDSFKGFHRSCSDCRKALRYLHDRSHDIKDRCEKYGVNYIGFNLNEILERDQWRCRWCGISTPKEKRGKWWENDSPEVDHIWPLAAVKDGLKSPGHILENCCCACRKCNLKRSDNVIGEGAPEGVLIDSIPERRVWKENEYSELQGIFWNEFWNEFWNRLPVYRLTAPDRHWIKAKPVAHRGRLDTCPTYYLKCSQCGDSFQSKRGDAKFCSLQCVGRFQRGKIVSPAVIEKCRKAANVWWTKQKKI